LNDSMLRILNKYASTPRADAVFCFGLQAFPIYKKEN